MQEILQGKYRILHEIGQGGMAVVYKGIDTALEREVAVKVLHPHLANRADSRMRFHREAKAVAKLHHPNILEIYDYSGMESSESWIVTEYIRGETLKDFTDRHAPNLPEVGALVVHEVAAALSHAHESGIIHRDIKPENIMIRDDGVLKLMDFGIAQIVDMQAMTVTGALVGSPAHMSPEHVEGKPLDFRADVFSLGTLLYMLSTGRLPFDSPSPHALLRQILEAKYDDPRLHNPAISRRLHHIITTCLQREPEARYGSVELLAADLGAYLRDLGLDDPARELVAYFDDPPSAEAALTRRVVDRLMARAREAAEAGSVAAALEAYNQVLALQGDREDALSQVQRLSTARSRSTLIRRAAMIAAAAGGVAFVAWQAAPSPSADAPLPDVSRHVAAVPMMVAPAPPAPARAAPAPAPPRIAIDPRPAEDRTDRLGERQGLHLAVAEPAPKLPAAKPTPKTEREKRVVTPPAGPEAKAVATGITFALLSDPPAAEIQFDGQTYRNGRTPKLTRPEGRYRIVIHHPSCDVCEDRGYWLTLDAKSPPAAEMIYQVGFKPAYLTVDTVAGAVVEVAGRVATPGEKKEIKMYRRTIEVLVKVRARGYRDAARRVQLAAGVATATTIPLTPDMPESAPGP